MTKKARNVQNAELRAKELQTLAFFIIVSYFAILADAVFI
jgi:hypothetical protein